MSVTLSPSGWYTRLWTYKRGRFNDYADTIGALSWSFTRAFSIEIVKLLGGEPTVWTIVPSTREDVDFQNNLFRRALELVKGMSGMVSETLRHTPGHAVPHNSYHPEAFAPGPVPVTGERVVLLEDTWVSGSKAVSAAGALHRDGAESVAILPVARKIDETCDRDYLEASRAAFALSWPRKS